MSNEVTPAAVTNTTTTAAATATPATPATAVVAEQTASLLNDKVVPATTADPVKTDEAKKEETKVDPPAVATKVVPEKYEIKLPEGSPLDPSAIERISAKAKADGLSNEEAQSELNREAAIAASQQEFLNKQITERQDQWLKTTQNDPEIGGANLNASISQAQRVIARYGNDALKNELNLSKLGNHPEFVRFVAKIAKDMADDVSVNGGSRPSSTKSLTDVLYDKKE